MLGFSVKKTIGIGDAVQFTSVPENYYRTTGKKLVDTNHHWVFDHNPYVIRDAKIKLSKTVEFWNYGIAQPVPPGREFVYLSLAERHAAMVEAKVFLRYPRLYIHEDYPFFKRNKILLQTHGVSHGSLPKHVIDHVLKKYKSEDLFHIGLPSDPDLGIPKLPTPTMNDLIKVISECRMLICPDSGPSWIAACYPDVIIKKVRTKPSLDILQNWVPLQIQNIHSHWDDRVAQIFNLSEDDVGFTASYRRI